jgi:hypothetical protein
MKFPYFLFHRAGKDPLKRFDRTAFRFIEGGPGTEELIIDGLRKGEEIRSLGVIFLEELYKRDLSDVPIIGVERVFGNDLWIIKFRVGARIFEAFYSTKTRRGYVCNPRKIDLWPNGSTYRPLTAEHLMTLLALTEIANSFNLSKHILARIISSIKGIQNFHSYDETIYENEPGEIVKKIQDIKNAFHNTRKARKDKALLGGFIEVLG